MFGEGFGVCLDVLVGFDDAAFVHHLLVPAFVDTYDDDLVITQQALLDCLAEVELVDDRTEDGLVVHGGDLNVGLPGLLLDPGRVGARGGRHEQALLGSDRLVIEDGAVDGRDLACTSMGFVGDDQVEAGDPVAGLCFGDLVGRLVGGEHDLAAALAQERGDVVRVGGDGIFEVGGEHHGGVVSAADGVVRTDRQVGERFLRVDQPFGDGLGQQGQRRNQHQGALGFEAFGDPQCGERLAGAARGDELASFAEVLGDVVDGLGLVGPALHRLAGTAAP